MTRVIELTVCLTLLGAAAVAGQPRPQTPPPPPPSTRGTGATSAPPGPQAPATRPAPTTAAPTPTTTAAAPGTSTPATAAPRQVQTLSANAAGSEPAPTEAQLGLPIYPGAKFLRSYDAGQGQRYYLFGSTATFGELVMYYRTQLKDKGDLVYDVPPVHMFEVGKFREETMAFPPGVTIKDYTSGGGKGYLVPTPGANPSRYPTVIQIVPVTAANR
ncbi:hypothetical protein TBR22_A48330 [Luteitalea sp. TBR-22]|uniref:hypothetical protein n=1 Tax=Luteitalea sp. TBR-22 TaxID=2802971 RepID=UPI001AF662C6|nr:hypothetical protein [Luteitalea sp. TBR-22]BCS35599.1 hypothetical protein TBR22_A48330 [Luteitalea sp. TBR-22]